jgi:hypothetical protein
MKASPDKFQAIPIGKKTKNENISFNLNSNIIKCEDEVKHVLHMCCQYHHRYISEL